jgi:drug/metabolite transporter (DMT)-like permease
MRLVTSPRPRVSRTPKIPSGPDRVVIGVAGVIVAVLAVPGVVVVMFTGGYAGMVPDPSIMDGDPCCGHPDTWNEVYASAGAGVAAAFVVGLILALAVGLLSVASTGERPRIKRLLLIPVATAALALAVFTWLIAPTLTEPVFAGPTSECRPVNHPEQLGDC